jgi:hypothetical protein
MRMFSKIAGAWRACAWTLVLVLSCAALAAAFPVEEGGEAAVCTAALSRCVGEAIVSGLFSAGATLFYYVSFCLIGWDFCQRYLQG